MGNIFDELAEDMLELQNPPTFWQRAWEHLIRGILTVFFACHVAALVIGWAVIIWFLFL